MAPVSLMSVLIGIAMHGAKPLTVMLQSKNQVMCTAFFQGYLWIPRAMLTPLGYVRYNTG
jgi:hypothetical protein